MVRPSGYILKLFWYLFLHDFRVLQEFIKLSQHYSNIVLNGVANEHFVIDRFCCKVRLIILGWLTWFTYLTREGCKVVSHQSILCTQSHSVSSQYCKVIDLNNQSVWTHFWSCKPTIKLSVGSVLWKEPRKDMIQVVFLVPRLETADLESSPVFFFCMSVNIEVYLC